MVAHEVSKLESAPSRKNQLTAELATIKSQQASLMQQIQDRHAEGRPRLAILDDHLDELEVNREKLVTELAAAEEPAAEDFQEKIARLKAQFNGERDEHPTFPFAIAAARTAPSPIGAERDGRRSR